MARLLALTQVPGPLTWNLYIITFIFRHLLDLDLTPIQSRSRDLKISCLDRKTKLTEPTHRNNPFNAQDSTHLKPFSSFAAAASSASSRMTNPWPRERPVSRSRATFCPRNLVSRARVSDVQLREERTTSTILLDLSKHALSLLSVVLHDRLLYREVGLVRMLGEWERHRTRRMLTTYWTLSLVDILAAGGVMYWD